MIVLTQLQLNEAIVRGLTAMNLLNGAGKAEALRLAKSNNGFLVATFDGATPAASSAPIEHTKKPGRPAAVKTNETAALSTGTEPIDPALAPENVKAALKTAMSHPPGVTTIAKWTPEQRVQAVRWTKAYAKDNTKAAPSFIVPRAVRGSKKNDGASVSPPAPVSNGTKAPEAPFAGASDAGTFFDDAN